MQDVLSLIGNKVITVLLLHVPRAREQTVKQAGTAADSSHTHVTNTLQQLRQYLNTAILLHVGKLIEVLGRLHYNTFG